MELEAPEQGLNSLEKILDLGVGCGRIWSRCVCRISVIVTSFCLWRHFTGRSSHSKGFFSSKPSAVSYSFNATIRSTHDMSAASLLHFDFWRLCVRQRWMNHARDASHFKTSTCISPKIVTKSVCRNKAIDIQFGGRWLSVAPTWLPAWR